MLRTLGCVGLALIFAACVAPEGTPGHRSRLTRLYTHFETLAPHRAMAIAGDPELAWVGAAVGGHASPAAAERGALAECQKRRVARRMQMPCRIYAVGNQVVWPPER